MTYVTLIFHPEKNGLTKILRNYQQEALNSFWKSNEKSQSSREVNEYVNGKIDGSISHASIIQFLKVMADEGVLDYEERKGRGGIKRVYRPRKNESEFKTYVAQTVISSLLKDFPDETKTVLRQLSM